MILIIKSRLTDGNGIRRGNFNRRIIRISKRFAAVQCGEKSLTPVIGLEIHAQLHCASKLFSDASSANSMDFEARSQIAQRLNLAPAFSSTAASNSLVGLFDMATPGTLPRLNYRSVQQSLRAATLLNCRIPAWCRFDRKHYFYPDMPSGYQITQKDYPIAEDGYLDYFVYPSITPFAALTARRKSANFVEVESLACRLVRCGIERLQLETDSGKLLKFDGDLELIDLNRAGVALVEIVTRPELHSAREAACFVEQLRELLHFNGVCEGEMHKGHLRVDANVSISVDGAPGARTEIKNINSFRFLHGAIEQEIRRQCAVLLAGDTVAEETRNLNTETMETTPMREKGDDLDYRFTPEPNLPRLELRQAWVAEAASSITHNLPYMDYVRRFDFPPSFALYVAREDQLRYFIDLCLVDLKRMEFAKFYEWLIEYKRICENITQNFPPTNDVVVRSFRDIIRFEHQGKLTRAICFDLLKAYVSIMDNSTVSVEEEIDRKNLWRIREPKEIESYINETLDARPELLEKALANYGPTLVNKHFNRLRNEVVIRSQKRVDVTDVEDLLFQKLSKKNLK